MILDSQYDETTLIVLHKPWSSRLERCSKDGEVLSKVEVSGRIEPILEPDPENHGFPPVITGLDVYAHAVAAALQQHDGSLPCFLVPMDGMNPFLESGGAPYSQSEWELIRSKLRSHQLSLLDGKDNPTKAHMRIQVVQPCKWTAHLVCKGNERVDLSGVLAAGAYEKVEMNGTAVIKVPVTNPLLQVAALHACLTAAAARPEPTVLLGDSALNGALHVAWLDWEKALRGPLSKTVAAAHPWVLDSLEFIRRGRGETYAFVWSGIKNQFQSMTVKVCQTYK